MDNTHTAVVGLLGLTVALVSFFFLIPALGGGRAPPNNLVAGNAFASASAAGPAVALARDPQALVAPVAAAAAAAPFGKGRAASGRYINAQEAVELVSEALPSVARVVNEGRGGLVGRHARRPQPSDIANLEGYGFVRPLGPKEGTAHATAGDVQASQLRASEDAHNEGLGTRHERAAIARHAAMRAEVAAMPSLAARISEISSIQTISS